MKALMFVFQSAVIGLAAAFVVLLLRGQLAMDDKPIHPPLTPVIGGVSAAKVLQANSATLSFADAVDAAAPAVVNIYTSKYVTRRRNPLLDDPVFQHFFGQALRTPGQQRETRLGSGVIVSPDGYIVTNNHVIFSADEISVTLRDGRSLDAKLIGSDPESDLAILKIDLQDYPSILIGNSTSVRIGDVVLAIGNPFGVGQTVTQGIISATGRNRVGINTFENFIQTDADINPGNSGGALINASGEFVGLITAIISQSGGSQGISFAVPSNAAINLMYTIIEQGSVVRGWLGLEVQNLSGPLGPAIGLGQVGGVLVERLVTGGPSDRAGIRPGDVITGINGLQIIDAREAVDVISSFEPGTHIDLSIIRDGKTINIRTSVAKRPKT